MDKCHELRDALIAWRKADRTHAHAVLASAHPVHLRNLDNARRNALNKVRMLVDIQPWGAAEQPIQPSDRVERFEPFMRG